ncbi:MAG: PilW family protein, partial [Gemmatimonadota bacterium]
MTPRLTQTRGFTLVEMLMALVVLGIMGLGLAKVFRVQHQVHAAQNRGITATQNARAGVDMMVREMRNAGYDPRVSADAGLTEHTATRVAWTADLNGDGDDADFGLMADEVVAYEFQPDSSALVRTVNGVTSRVADGISNLQFVYRDNDGNTTGSADLIEQVDVAVEYETSDGSMAGRILTQVAIRNNIYAGSKFNDGKGSSGNSGTSNGDGGVSGTPIGDGDVGIPDVTLPPEPDLTPPPEA